MKYKKPWKATMLNCSDAIVHEICRCHWWSIHCRRGNTTSSGQHVGAASNMWKGKWFNLNRPGFISFIGKRGKYKDWPIPKAFQLPGGNIGILVLIFGLSLKRILRRRLLQHGRIILFLSVDKSKAYVCPKQHFLSYLMIKVFQIVPSSASVASSHVSKPSAAGPARTMMAGGEQPGSICVSSVELSSPSCEDTWDNSSY